MLVDWLITHLLGLLLVIIGVMPVGALELPSLVPFFSFIMAVDEIAPVSEIIEFARYGIEGFFIIFGFRFFMWIVSQTPILGRGVGG